MASDAFNGAVATFAASALGSGLRGIRYTESGATADVTGSGDSEKTHEPGVPDKELVIDFVGTTTVGMGDKGAIVVTWDDAFNSKLDLAPDELTWDTKPPVMPDENGLYACAIPGIGKAW